MNAIRKAGVTIASTFLLMFSAAFMEDVAAQISPMGEIDCKWCYETVEPGYGTIHIFNGTAFALYHCTVNEPCHGDWRIDSCELRHSSPCSMAAAEEAAERVLWAAELGDLDEVGRVAADYQDFIQYNAEERTIDVRSCDGTLLARIPSLRESLY